ncbi:MAG: quinone-dependent dihydroorotate dehydrogenase [Cyclobacteriaceae bacterium]
MYTLVRKFLFLLPAETAHHFTINLVRVLFRIPMVKSIFSELNRIKDPRLQRTVFGLTFPNPVGLAAGFDKNGAFTNEFSAMGFGFIEIGTVTPLPQPGNPKPRLFRLKEDQALINRMGFNNEGMESVVKNLRKRSKEVIIGGNIGKNKVTPNEQAPDDYQKCFETLYPHVDYFVVNVSSPNTPGLRELQEKEPLQKLLQSLKTLNEAKPAPKPILLKIAPDLTDSQLDDILEITAQVNIDGVIATNTTIDRSGLRTKKEKIDKIGAGGLSGAPLFDRSTEIIKYLKNGNKNLVIIAVGGINSPERALEKLKAGASLVQVYTGLIYGGPVLIRNINRAILKNLDGA